MDIVYAVSLELAEDIEFAVGVWRKEIYGFWLGVYGDEGTERGKVAREEWNRTWFRGRSWRTGELIEWMRGELGEV